MVNIAVEYQPFPFLKYTRLFHGSFPSRYSELSPKQFIAICQLIQGSINESRFLVKMTGIRKLSSKLLNHYCRHKLMELFDPFTEIAPHNEFIIPSIQTSENLFVCPHPKLSGMTIGQFIFVDSYFSNYQDSKEPIDLHKFIASLYLPQNRNFNENEILYREIGSKKIKPEVLEAIVINWLLIKEWLCTIYPLIFQKPNDPDKDEKKQKRTKKNSGWLEVFESIVGDDLVNHDRYAMLPVHNVFRWMTKRIKDNQRKK